MHTIIMHRLVVSKLFHTFKVFAVLLSFFILVFGFAVHYNVYKYTIITRNLVTTTRLPACGKNGVTISTDEHFLGLG